MNDEPWALSVSVIDDVLMNGPPPQTPYTDKQQAISSSKIVQKRAKLTDFRRLATSLQLILAPADYSCASDESR